MKTLAFLFAALLGSIASAGMMGHSFAQGMPGGPAHRAPQPQGAPQREMLNVMQQSHLRIMNQQMTGNADRDFARLMLVQHQATIDAARIELQYGKDAQARTMAEELIRTRERDLQRTRTILNAIP